MQALVDIIIHLSDVKHWHRSIRHQTTQSQQVPWRARKPRWRPKQSTPASSHSGSKRGKMRLGIRSARWVRLMTQHLISVFTKLGPNCDVMEVGTRTRLSVSKVHWMGLRTMARSIARTLGLHVIRHNHMCVHDMRFDRFLCLSACTCKIGVAIKLFTFC